MRLASFKVLLAASLLLLPAACKKDKASESGGPEDTETDTPEGDAEDKGAIVPAGPMGTLSGRITLSGEPPEMPTLQRGADPVCARTEAKAETVLTEDGGLANVVVRIKPGTVAGPVPSEPVEVDQVECMYRPRVQPGVVGQTIAVKNGDETMHNVHARRLELGKRQGTETIVNRAQPAGMKPIGIRIEEGEDVVKLKCDSHGWMQGFVVVSDNPYATVTAKDGSYRFALPVGEHEIQTWHEFYGTKTARVTISEGSEATLDLGYDAEADNPLTSGGAGDAAESGDKGEAGDAP